MPTPPPPERAVHTTVPRKDDPEKGLQTTKVVWLLRGALI
jgi:hypothetical protein